MLKLIKNEKKKIKIKMFKTLSTKVKRIKVML
jgi:hypothetical protein